MDNTSTIEEKRVGQLQQARNLENAGDNPVKKTKAVLSFGEKLFKHWWILAIAVFFDILGLIPFLNVIFNAVFTGILWMYFGPKKMDKILLGVGIASIVDFFIGIVPVNTGAVLFRIAMKEQ